MFVLVSFGSAVCVLVGCLGFIAAVLVCIFVRATLVARDQEAAVRAKAELLKTQEQVKAELLKKQERLKAEYSKAYEERKITIGTIKCPQCKWTGQWGTGMTYEEFFLYDLTVKHKLKVSLSIHSPSNLNDDAQYKCPQCKSINWQKV